MKSVKEMVELSHAIGRAIMEYHKAVADNLKESGKKFSVAGDDEDVDVDGLRLSIRGRHDDLVDVVVDKVCYHTSENGTEYVQVHICEEEYKDCDYWLMADSFGDDIDYIYDNIVWE